MKPANCAGDAEREPRLITYRSKTPPTVAGQFLSTRPFGEVLFDPSPTEKPVRILCVD